MNRISPLLWCFSMVICLGCSRSPTPRVDTVYRDQAIDLEELKKGGVAIGGVIVRDGVNLNCHPDLPWLSTPADNIEQSYNWSPLFGACLEKIARDVKVMPFFRIRDLVVDDVLQAFHNRLAGGQSAPPDLLAEFRESLGGIRFLVIARIDNDNLTLTGTAGHDGPRTLPELIADDKRPGGWLFRKSETDDLDERLKQMMLQRDVTVSLFLVDLEEGRSIWEARAERAGTSFISQEDEALLSGSPQGDQIPGIFNLGDIKEGPAFTPLLDQCLKDLLKWMIQIEPLQEPGTLR
ncbi:MAG: hypothetical protein ABIK96_09570 [bacterium]